MTKKLKVGRPALGRAARTHVVAVKFSLDEIATIKRSARRARITTSDWIRDHALGVDRVSADLAEAARLLALVVCGGSPTGIEWQMINELIREVSK